MIIKRVIIAYLIALLIILPIFVRHMEIDAYADIAMTYGIEDVPILKLLLAGGIGYQAKESGEAILKEFATNQEFRSNLKNIVQEKWNQVKNQNPTWSQNLKNALKTGEGWDKVNPSLPPGGPNSSTSGATVLGTLAVDAFMNTDVGTLQDYVNNWVNQNFNKGQNDIVIGGNNDEFQKWNNFSDTPVQSILYPYQFIVRCDSKDFLIISDFPMFYFNPSGNIRQINVNGGKVGIYEKYHGSTNWTLWTLNTTLPLNISSAIWDMRESNNPVFKTSNLDSVYFDRTTELTNPIIINIYGDQIIGNQQPWVNPQTGTSPIYVPLTADMLEVDPVTDEVVIKETISNTTMQDIINHYINNNYYNIQNEAPQTTINYTYNQDPADMSRVEHLLEQIRQNTQDAQNVNTSPESFSTVFQNKTGYQVFNQSMAKLKNMNTAQAQPPVIKFNFRELWIACTSRFGAPSYPFDQDEFVLLDFKYLQDIEYENVSVIEYLRGFMSMGMILITLFYVWRKIVPKEAVS